jgi:hypothetical protein
MNHGVLKAVGRRSLYNRVVLLVVVVVIVDLLESVSRVVSS